MTTHLFTYGTLLFPEIMEALTERSFAFEELTLGNFERRALLGRSYPGLIDSKGASVSGRLWFDLDEKSMQVLDHFEDDEYERRTISVFSKERGPLNARVYVLTLENAGRLSAEPWSPADFQRSTLPRYLQRCKEFRADALKNGIGV